jgi:NAD(P)-dependent dehydrogenase (short-subunit alcohol dehydrogenase family)
MKESVMPKSRSSKDAAGSSSRAPRSNVREFPSPAAREKAAVGRVQKPLAGKQPQPRPPFPEQKQQRPGIEAKMEPRPKYTGRNYRPANKLEGKVALITGGDSGIGRAVAVLYAREGADVAIIYLPEEEQDAQETINAIEAAGRRGLPIPGDVTDPHFCREAVEETVRELGKLDILVNNAAFQQHQPEVEQISEEQWDKAFRTNIYGYFQITKAALPHLREGSAIINTGSVTALEGNRQLVDYASTKGAIHAFSKSLAQNLVERGIRVNCVAPGPVWTPLSVADKEAKEAGKHAETPMERPAQPEEVAPAYVFFASEADSSHITGEVLTLLGSSS